MFSTEMEVYLFLCQLKKLLLIGSLDQAKTIPVTKVGPHEGICGDSTQLNHVSVWFVKDRKCSRNFKNTITCKGGPLLICDKEWGINFMQLSPSFELFWSFHSKYTLVSPWLCMSTVNKPLRLCNVMSFKAIHDVNHKATIAIKNPQDR